MSFGVAFGNGTAPYAGGKGAAFSTTSNQQQVTVPINQSRLINLRSPIAQVSVANPEIADILVIDPRQIYVVGKQLGTTNVVLWDDNDRVKGMIGLEVTHDLQGLKGKLHQLLPNERINVRSANGSIVVSGEVSSPQKVTAAVRLAKSYAGEDGGGGGLSGDKDSRVLNLIQVGGAQQVMLEVKVAEIARTLIRNLDVDFTGFYNGGSIKIGAVNGGAAFPDAVFGNNRLPLFGDGALVGPAVREFLPNTSVIEDKGLFAQYLSGNFLFNLVINAGKEQGLAKILAEPNLTTLSGQEAKFLAGGEFPIPVPQDLGRTTIEYKEFGVGLKFVPVVLDSGVISTKVNVTVSDLTPENSLAIGFVGSEVNRDFFVPALTKRAANATVEVKSGQTIAIAGLINENLRESVDKFPGLGDLPIIGILFRSQEFVKGQTELVIFVTPRLARPFKPELVKLPTDSFVEPSDQEFYLMGQLERSKPKKGQTGNLGPDKAGSEGHFGHDL
ncbi:MAG: type II and III secretion system protein family protein [Pseudomonadota bacterium]|nr:type II and III secretion system protein family protein [Pseudomonadota bacterium]